jgi:hydroxypyruvate isomerase
MIPIPPRLRFDANVSILFPDRPLLTRPESAAREGFDAIEMWWPFDRSVPAGGDVDQLVAAVRDAGVSLVLLNLDTGNPEAGEHGLLSLPDQRARFRDNVDAAMEIAGRLGGRVVNALYGNVRDDLPPAQARDTAVENLAYAATKAAGIGATVVLEALNPIDFPRYGLHRIEEAADLADRMPGAPASPVKLLFDVYNVQRSEGDLLRRIGAYASRFGHVQIADVPARLHPGTGEIAFERVLPALDQAGYDGFVGLEYRPSKDDIETFAWLPRGRRRSRS